MSRDWNFDEELSGSFGELRAEAERLRHRVSEVRLQVDPTGFYAIVYVMDAGEGIE